MLDWFSPPWHIFICLLVVLIICHVELRVSFSKEPDSFWLVCIVSNGYVLNTCIDLHDRVELLMMKLSFFHHYQLLWKLRSDVFREVGTALLNEERDRKVFPEGLERDETYLVFWLPVHLDLFCYLLGKSLTFISSSQVLQVSFDWRLWCWIQVIFVRSFILLVIGGLLVSSKLLLHTEINHKLLRLRILSEDLNHIREPIEGILLWKLRERCSKSSSSDLKH